MIKNTISIIEINIEIKTTTTAVIKNEYKYFLMSEGNTCIAEPNLEVLPLIWFRKGLVQFLFLKMGVWSGETFLKCYCFTIR